MRSVNGLRQHTEKLEPLSRPNRNKVKQRILNMSLIDVSCHELCRRHILKRCVRENFPGHNCLRKLVEETVFDIRVHLKCVAQSHLPFLNIRKHRELLVDELRCGYRMRSLISIVCRQVVILTRVKYDSAVTDDYTAHKLVNDSPLHIDVAEEDSVDSVVKHYVESLESAHGRNLRHAES